MEAFATIICIATYAGLVYTIPPLQCFANFNWNDCGKAPQPVIYYWKPGSRCEVGTWRGCLPNINMFKDEYECVSTCIFTVRAAEQDWHQISVTEDDNMMDYEAIEGEGDEGAVDEGAVDEGVVDEGAIDVDAPTENPNEIDSVTPPDPSTSNDTGTPETESSEGEDPKMTSEVEDSETKSETENTETKEETTNTESEKEDENTENETKEGTYNTTTE